MIVQIDRHKGEICIFTKDKAARQREKAYSNISVRSFLTVALILIVLLIFTGSLSCFVPQGSFDRDASGNILPGTYAKGETHGIALWRVVTAPARVFLSEDALTISMISAFLLVMSGIFNLVDKTGGIRTFIVFIMRRLNERGAALVCITVLIFMLFGSLFGMFEELVTLLPLIIVFMLSINLDTMVGLGACLMAACFGFSAAITNPFSVGTAAQLARIPVASGVWLRIVFFLIVFVLMCAFLILYVKKIRRNPKCSLTYEADQIKRERLVGHIEEAPKDQRRIFKVYAVFFAIQGLLLVLIACIRAISGLAIPILAVSFLISGIIAGKIACGSLKRALVYFLKGALAMLPAVVMIALASSIKLVMYESGIIDTVMHMVMNLLDGKGKFVTILLIYALILFLQLFIGSASAKIFLVMPIVLPITNALSISPALVILTYCMADGFTDVIMPTNPVLLIGLSMANVSYGKWVRWTWKIQITVFASSVLVLLFGVLIGY